MLRTDNTVALIGCLGLIPALLIGWMLKAWAIITLWGWFIYPTWHIVAPSRAAAVGLVILLTTLNGVDKQSSSDNEGKSATPIMVRCYAKIILSPVVAVFGGWCAKAWLS